MKKANPSQPPSPAPTSTAGGGGAYDQAGRGEEHVKEDESTMMAATSTGEEGEGGRRRERREGRSLRGIVTKSKPFPLNCGQEENTLSDILLHFEAVSKKLPKLTLTHVVEYASCVSKPSFSETFLKSICFHIFTI